MVAAMIASVAFVIATILKLFFNSEVGSHHPLGRLVN